MRIAHVVGARPNFVTMAPVIDALSAGVLCIEPVRYLEFLSLEIGAGAVVTDSGGVQEETSALGVPCYTLRRNTERPITLTHGTNALLGDDPDSLREIRLDSPAPTPAPIPLWDGRAGRRVADALTTALRAEPQYEHG